MNQQIAAPVPFAAFRDELLTLYEPPMRSPKTRAGMKYALRCLEELGVHSTEDLTVVLIGKFVASRPSSNGANRILGVLSYIQAACTYAHKRGFVRMSPFHVRPIRDWVRATPPKGKRHCSREEIGRVLSLMKQRSQANGWAGWRWKRAFAMTSTFAGTGLRASEGYFLQMADLDFERDMIWIVSRAEHQLKTAGAAAPVPMAGFVKKALLEWLPHRLSRPPGHEVPDCPWVFPNTKLSVSRPWNGGAPGYRPLDVMKAAAAECDPPVLNFGPNCLRHSLATHLLSVGAGPGMIQRILRHTNTQTQQWYICHDMDNLRAAVSKLEF
jgi:integrase